MKSRCRFACLDSSHPVESRFWEGMKDVLNFDVALLHLQPREDVAQLRRGTMLPPLPAGNSLNEQYARAQLHAGNEADIDAPPATGGAAALEKFSGRQYVHGVGGGRCRIRSTTLIERRLGQV